MAIEYIHTLFSLCKVKYKKGGKQKRVYRSLFVVGGIPIEKILESRKVILI